MINDLKIFPKMLLRQLNCQFNIYSMAIKKENVFNL